LPTPLAQATRLVASIEAAQRTGQGDIRSKEVVEKLLVIARMWIAERTGPHRPYSSQRRPQRFSMLAFTTSHA
jgi:hypothetical protein